MMMIIIFSRMLVCNKWTKLPAFFADVYTNLQLTRKIHYTPQDIKRKIYSYMSKKDMERMPLRVCEWIILNTHN